MEHLKLFSVSRESTEAIAPFLTIIGVDNTFVSRIDIAKTKVYNPACPHSFRCFLYLFRQNLGEAAPFQEAAFQDSTFSQANFLVSINVFRDPDIRFYTVRHLARHHGKTNKLSKRNTQKSLGRH